MKIFSVADVPPELGQAWLQHLRDFDIAHPGCHFEVIADAPPEMTIREMVDVMRVNPDIPIVELLKFKRPPQDPKHGDLWKDSAGRQLYWNGTAKVWIELVLGDDVGGLVDRGADRWSDPIAAEMGSSDMAKDKE